MQAEELRAYLNQNFRFEIPAYQRSYAWEKDNVLDLVQDIYEALRTQTAHYIGTLVLCDTPGHRNVLQVVDGQQRLTTIFLIVNDLVSRLKGESQRNYHWALIGNPGELRITPLEQDQVFFNELILGREDGTIPVPQTKGQKRLSSAKQQIHDLLNSVSDPEHFLDAILSLKILAFRMSSEGEAIRIFQTVNDRGRALSNVDKLKALLIYYSNRYVEGKLDSYVNSQFGEFFQCYDNIKELGDQLRIEAISRQNFTEDNLLKQFRVMVDAEDYDPGASSIFNSIKRRLEGYASKSATEEIEKVILTYSDGLTDYAKTLEKILTTACEDTRYFKLFASLRMSVILYPLAVKLYRIGILESTSESDPVPIIALLEQFDLRVYKIGQKDVKRPVVNYIVNNVWEGQSVAAIQQWLRDFAKWRVPDGLMEQILTQQMYRNEALYHISIELGEKVEGQQFGIERLKELRSTASSHEHIFSQNQRFEYTTFGFTDEQEYQNRLHGIGNMALIEAELNPSAGNANPYEKASVYQQSIFPATRQLGAEILMTNRFTKYELEKRNNELVEFVLGRWGK